MGQEAEERIVQGLVPNAEQGNAGSAAPGAGQSKGSDAEQIAARNQAPQTGTASPAGMPPQTGTASPAGMPPQTGTASPAGMPPQAGTASPAGTPPQAGARRMVRISSPEQVDDYIRVTTPGMWLLAVAAAVLLAALIIWGFTTRLEVKTADETGQEVTQVVTPASYVTDGMTAN